MAQLKSLGKINQLYGVYPDGWCEDYDEANVYEMRFDIENPNNVNLDELLFHSGYYDDLIKFEAYVMGEKNDPHIIAHVVFSWIYSFGEGFTMDIDVVKKELPERLLKRYGIVATPQEYEPPVGI